MATTKRVSDEPAFVLHHYQWSESSLILETFTRQHGRVALVAKGAKRPSSNFRPVLLPLQPLRVGYAGDGEIRTLKRADWAGGHIMPTGAALLSGCYLNELLLRMTAREDPHPALFDRYADTVRLLAGTSGATGEAPPWALRAFELLLLRETGHLPALDHETLTLAPLRDDLAYTLRPESGLLRLPDPPASAAPERHPLRGADWRALQAALDHPSDAWAELLRVCAHRASGLKAPLRALLHYHCGVTTLRTRQLMMDLQAL